jgi:hypothetical protein
MGSDMLAIASSVLAGSPARWPENRNDDLSLRMETSVAQLLLGSSCAVRYVSQA